jgi:tetratricopeptide (TPR) repeat protein
LDAGGNRTAAVESYAAGIAAAPSLASSPFFSELRSRDGDRAGRILVSAANLLRAQAAERDDPILRSRLGALLLATGDLKASRSALESSLAALPNLSRAWANLATVLRLQGQTGAAARALERARFLAPHDPVVLREAIKSGAPDQGPATLVLISDHAAKAERIYLHADPIGDDLLPNGLLAYLAPRTGRIAPVAWSSFTHQGDLK